MTSIYLSDTSNNNQRRSRRRFTHWCVT